MSKNMMKYYKFLTKDNRGDYSLFDFTEYLPKNGRPGKWLPATESVKLCRIGYHVCTRDNLRPWINAQLFEVEGRGASIEGDDKIAFKQIRFVSKVREWNEKNLRLAAVEIAKTFARPVLEKRGDDLTVFDEILDTAERYAHGQATDFELDTAWDAAWHTTQDVARDAAWDAAWHTTQDVARDAAWDAARAAARDAAWAAARDTARDAAWYTARDAAWEIIYERCGVK